MSKRILYPLELIAAGVILVASLAGLNAQQSAGETVSIGNDDISGVVTSAKGSEAGVWVIAETTDPQTKFVKIVVTDDGGRYVLPQLPKANYKVWVRGYGLVDSQPFQTVPGKIVNLTAVAAPNPRAAAEYYPAVYWFSLLRVPDKREFPGTGPKGNGIPENMKNQGQWLHLLKTDSCWSCHQMGDKATREIPKSLGHFDSSTAAWARRVLSGQAGNNMINGLAQLGSERALPMFADWTDRIAVGELPLGTAKFLSREPMERRNPIAYVLNGIRYKATGCGLRGGYRGQAKIPTAFRRLIHDSRYWFEEVIGPESARIAIPVSVAVDNTERPCCGITWIFPPTLANSAETTSS